MLINSEENIEYRGNGGGKFECHELSFVDEMKVKWKIGLDT